MSWKKRYRDQQQGETSWFLGFLKGLVSGASLTVLAVLGLLFVLPEFERPGLDPDAAAVAPSDGRDAVPEDGLETAAVREERGRSGPRSEGNFAEETVLPAEPVGIPSRAPTVAAPGGGSAPVVAPQAPIGDTDAIAGLDTSVLSGSQPSADPGLGRTVRPGGSNSLLAPSAPPGSLIAPVPGGAVPGDAGPGGVAPLGSGPSGAGPSGAGPSGAGPSAPPAATLPTDGLLTEGGIAGAPAPQAPAPSLGSTVGDAPEETALDRDAAREELAALEAALAADNAAGAEGTSAVAAEPGDSVASSPDGPSQIDAMTPDEAREALAALGVDLSAPAETGEAAVEAPAAAEEAAAPEPLATPLAPALADQAPIPEAPAIGDPAAADTASEDIVTAALDPATVPSETENDASVPFGGVIGPGDVIDDTSTGIPPVPGSKPDPNAQEAALAPATDAPLAADAALSVSDDDPAAASEPERAAPSDDRLALAGPALDVNARDFNAPAAGRMVALVLLATDGDDPLAAEVIEGLPFPVAIGVVAGEPGSADTASAIRAAGHEVIAELSSSVGAEEAVEALAEVPVSIAAAFTKGDGRGDNIAPEVLETLGQYGFAYFDSRIIGGGAALRAARAASLPAISPDRGGIGATTEAQLLQTLNIAARVARRQGSAVVVAPASAASLRAAMRFALEGAGEATIAPLSAVIRQRSGG